MLLSRVGERFFDPILAGKAVRVIGDPDALHSHTYLPDFTYLADFERALIELNPRCVASP